METNLDQMKLVPTELLERAKLLLETNAQYGMLEKYEDGTKTPNAILCEDVAAALGQCKGPVTLEDILRFTPEQLLHVARNTLIPTNQKKREALVNLVSALEAKDS